MRQSTQRPASGTWHGGRAGGGEPSTKEEHPRVAQEEGARALRARPDEAGFGRAHLQGARPRGSDENAGLGREARAPRSSSSQMPAAGGRDKVIAMATKTSSHQALLDKIQSLPPEKVAEVEDFVDFLRQRVDDSALV